jgi:hypothetical protein
MEAGFNDEEVEPDIEHVYQYESCRARRLANFFEKSGVLQETIGESRLTASFADDRRSMSPIAPHRTTSLANAV